MLAHGVAGGAADGGSRLAGDDETLPGGGRRLPIGAGDLHLVAIAQLREQGRDAAIDLAADGAIAEFRMDRIGEIDGRRPARQGDEPPLGREAENLIVEELELGVLEELFGTVALGQHLDGAAQPAIGAALMGQLFRVARPALLVERMGGDAIFGDVVHLPCAHLQLDALAPRPHHGGVDGAIIVLLGGRDIVLEPARHGRPFGMDHAQRPIAVLDLVHDNAKAEDVGQLLEGDGFVLHLAEHGIGRLLPALHLRDDAAFGQLLGQLAFDVADELAIVRLEIVEPRLDHGVGFGHQGLESQILQLVAHMLHAHAPGERGIDVQRFLRHPGPLLRGHEMQGAHVVQAIRELDEQHPHILGDGQQQLAKIFRLFGALGDEIQLLELGQAIDQARDLGAEEMLDLLLRGGGVLDRVVQDRSHDGGVVKPEVGEDGGDFERMGEIRIARRSLLLTMSLHGVDIGAVQQIFVGVRIVAPHAVNQIVLTHHLRIELRGQQPSCQ